MTVTAEILREYLSENSVSITVCGVADKKFRRFRFATPDTEFLPEDVRDDLYFVRGECSNLIAEKGLNAIVAADAPLRPPADARCLIRADCDEAALLAATQDCFSSINDWIGSLYESIAAGCSLGDLLDLSASVMHNPILIDDSSYQTLALSKRYKADKFSDVEYAFQFKNGYHSSEYVSHMLNSSFAPKAADLAPKPIILSFDFLAHRTLYSTVKTEGEIVAFFSMIEVETAFTAGLADLCEIFTRILSVAFSKRVHTSQFKQRRFNNDLFLSILTGRVTDGKTMRAIFTQANLSAGVHFVAYIKVGKGAPSPDPFLLSRIIELFSVHLRNCHAILDGRNIVLIVRDTGDEDAKERIMKINNEFFNAFNPITGFSIDFEVLEEIHLYFEQAKAAAGLGPLSASDRNAFHYYRIVGYDLLNRLASDAERNAVCHPAIRVLLKHDAEKDSKLIPTLRAIIECAGDTAMAAQRLFLHRNSVYYRMNRIVKLTGINLQDEQTREHLRISLRVIDINAANAETAAEL